MKLARWIPLIFTLALYGQERPSKEAVPEVSLKALEFQNAQNSFHETDETLLFGYNLLEKSIHSNFGSALIPLWWKPSNHLELKIRDRLDYTQTSGENYKELYPHNFPHTKIIYAPTYVEGQKINVLHNRRYKYGSVLVDYNRLISEGFLLHEKNKHSYFALHANYQHPNIPYSSNIKFHFYKNESEWNGGLSNHILFTENSETNWKIFAVNWGELKTKINRKGLDWKHNYSISEKSELEYEINLHIDTLHYEGLKDDTLVYPSRTDSSSALTRIFSNTIQNIKWKHQIDSLNEVTFGIKHQHFKYQSTNLNRWMLFGYLSSKKLDNSFYLSYHKDIDKPSNFIGRYQQNVSLFGLKHHFKLAYEKTLPNWLMQNDYVLFSIGQSSALNDLKPSTDQYIEWTTSLTDRISVFNSFHQIEHFYFYNETAMATVSEKAIHLFQSRLKHHLTYKKWHWQGEIAHQHSSNLNIPLAKIIAHQKLYWEGYALKKATKAQIGTRILYKSEHSGMAFSPFLNDFFLAPSYKSAASLRCDLFANFQVKTLKIFLSYEHFNSLWEGNQFVLNPFPVAKPLFRMSLIWNFYD